MLNVEFGLPPKTPDDECNVIYNLFDGLKPDVYMKKNMVEDAEFFLLNKKFWEDWRSYSGHNQKKISTAKKPMGIKNEEFKA